MLIELHIITKKLKLITFLIKFENYFKIILNEIVKKRALYDINDIIYLN